MEDQSGFTLIELIVVVAIFGTLVAIALGIGIGDLKKQRLAEASRALQADFQKVRMDALTTSSPGATTRGFGIRFSSDTTYFTFEFDDADEDFIYDPLTEELNGKERTLPTGVTVQRKSGGSLVDPNSTDDDIILYDKRGMIRNVNWNSTSGTFVLQVPGVTPSRCVVIDEVRIREGAMNGTTCNPS